MSSDFLFLKNLVSRMLHDIASPLGAVINGLDLIKEYEHYDEEMINLTQKSATKIDTKFRIWRTILSHDTPTATFAEVMPLIKQLCADNDKQFIDKTQAEQGSMTTSSNSFSTQLVLCIVYALSEIYGFQAMELAFERQVQARTYTDARTDMNTLNTRADAPNALRITIHSAQEIELTPDNQELMLGESTVCEQRNIIYRYIAMLAQRDKHVLSVVQPTARQISIVLYIA